MSDDGAAGLITALTTHYSRIGGAYIAALRAAGYDDEAIQADYLKNVRGDAGQTEEEFLVALVRRAREVMEQ